jgi:hypothetical protein
MPRKSETHIVVTGDGNNIASSNPSANTVTINGQTYDLPAGGTLTVDGNQVTTTRR